MVRLDTSPAERFLAYADGNEALADVWDHPAYDVVRRHADLLGREVSRDDVAAAMDGEETAFRHVDDLASNRDRIRDLLEHVADVADDWIDRIERELARITPDAALSEITVYLGIGYEFGIGTRDGAFVNLNEPLFLEHPRQLLYTVVHEISHVVYDHVHGYSEELTADSFISEQQHVFDTLFHTEAYATYTPLALRRDDGNVGEQDHPVCADYRVLDDRERLQELVAEYDVFRKRLQQESVSPEALLGTVFESRLPYRLGCALLDRIERDRGIEAVREGFHRDPTAFLSGYDAILDTYRDGS